MHFYNITFGVRVNIVGVKAAHGELVYAVHVAGSHTVGELFEVRLRVQLFQLARVELHQFVDPPLEFEL